MVYKHKIWIFCFIWIVFIGLQQQLHNNIIRLGPGGADDPTAATSNFLSSLSTFAMSTMDHPSGLVSTTGLQVNELEAPKPPPNTCHNFFAVLSNAFAPEDGNCTDVLQKYDDLLQVQNEQMQMMTQESHLTIFTTWSQSDLQDPRCSHYFDKYTHITMQQFDPQTLLLKHGFNATHIEYMKSWHSTVPRIRHAITRLSDVFRIVLQKEYGMSYLDLDIVLLMNDPRVYWQRPNVAMPIWKEEQGAMEIQNSAFCFSQSQLDFLITTIQQMMDDRGPKQLTKNMYMYTGLGPNLFQHTIQWLQLIEPVQLYYTHSDDHFLVEDVAALYKAYGGFVWLHLDGSNRRRNWYKNKKRTYPMLVEEFRQACQPLPSITKFIISSSTSSTTTTTRN